MNESAPESPSAFGALARRALAWVVLIAAAIVLLKVAVGIVIGFVHALAIIALLAVLGIGVLWALRHL